VEFCEMLTILVAETAKRRGLFTAALPDGRRLVHASRTPFCDTARVLMAEGYDPAETLQMCREIGGTIALSGKLGEVARVTVTDPDHGRPHFIWFRPYPTTIGHADER
jgi:hypothetical protein